MKRRHYLAVLGATLLAGCSSSDGSGRPEVTPSGPPVRSFGESYLAGTGVEVTCGGVEVVDVLEMDDESAPAPEGQRWALVDVRAENTAESSQTLPWRQALSIRYGDGEFAHDVNDTPVDFLFWDGGYVGGDPVDPGVVEEGVVPILVDAAAVGGDPTVVYDPVATDIETEIWWSDR